MPDGPNVDLNLGPAPQAPPNPITSAEGLVGLQSTLAEAQNRRNQALLFQQTMAARHAMGDDLAVMGAKGMTPEQMVQRLSTSSYAPFVMDVINSFASGNADQIAMAKTHQEMAAANEGRIAQVGASGMADTVDHDLAGLDKSMSVLRAGITDPQTLASFDKASSAYKTALTANLPLDPDDRRAAYVANKRNLGTILGGVDPNRAWQALPGRSGATVPPAIDTLPTASGAVVKGVVGGDTGLLPLGVGPSATQSEYMTKRAGDMADYQKNLDDRVLNEGQLRKNSDTIIGLAKEAKTGGGADVYKKIGETLQGLGVHSPTVDAWANGSLPASQAIDKISMTNAMSQLKTQLTGVGGSRINQQEFAAYLSKNPNLTSDPDTLVRVFNLWNEYYDKDKHEQQALDKFLHPEGDSAPGDIARWPSVWANSEYMKNFAPSTAFTSEGVKGARPPQGAIDYLNAHPTLKKEFEAKYPGNSADDYLKAK